MTGFLFTRRHRVQICCRAHPASYPAGTVGSYPGVKRLGREAFHSPTPNAEVKNTWSYTFAHPYVFLAWCLFKHKDNFTFTFCQ